MQEAKRLLSECVNGTLEEMERLQKVNKEIARADVNWLLLQLIVISHPHSGGEKYLSNNTLPSHL